MALYNYYDTGLQCLVVYWVHVVVRRSATMNVKNGGSQYCKREATANPSHDSRIYNSFSFLEIPSSNVLYIYNYIES